MRDYCENQQFRRDIFVKGPRTMTQAQQIDQLQSSRFMLITPEKEVQYKIAGPVGEAQLQGDVYRPIVAALAEGRHAPKSFAELAAHPTLRSVSAAQMAQALFVPHGTWLCQRRA